MNRLTQTIGVVLLASCTAFAAADNRYNDHSRGRWSDVRETFYVEARVISAEPLYETHWYYRSRGDSYDGRYEERCRVRDVEVYRSSSSAGPAGAIIGGAIGAHVGSNAGRSSESAIAGAIAGGVIGGLIGNEIDRDNTTIHYRQERECDREYRYERRTLIGYEVRYRYNGREFRILTDEHPGRYVQLRVEVEPTVR
ncbi:glycine zipper domain-containing protein [Reinekea blandensis]|uniref:Glycine zipper domain-containing protein n=1 Tax=Reinekea blandensis MED297 TaxID=314283 RepID=A4BBM8_9GAMM|nr:glycine zipper domain-containing protein [Reinekea blandensis]EAR10363.1 hypothetical protein MED297_01040 [Reinekea sp. MED297] [Reinekea blandensis MED297]